MSKKPDSKFDPENGKMVIFFESDGHNGHPIKQITVFPEVQRTIQTAGPNAYILHRQNQGRRLEYSPDQVHDVQKHIRERRDYLNLDYFELQHWAWVGVPEAIYGCYARGIPIPQKPPRIRTQPQPSAARTQPQQLPHLSYESLYAPVPSWASAFGTPPQQLSLLPYESPYVPVRLRASAFGTQPQQISHLVYESWCVPVPSRASASGTRPSRPTPNPQTQAESQSRHSSNSPNVDPENRPWLGQSRSPSVQAPSPNVQAPSPNVQAPSPVCRSKSPPCYDFQSPRQNPSSD